jgi:hypothetical protein
MNSGCQLQTMLHKSFGNNKDPSAKRDRGLIGDLATDYRNRGIYHCQLGEASRRDYQDVDPTQPADPPTAWIYPFTHHMYSQPYFTYKTTLDTLIRA